MHQDLADVCASIAVRLVFSPSCTQPGLRSSTASDARDWRCHPICLPTHPSSFDPSVGQQACEESQQPIMDKSRADRKLGVAGHPRLFLLGAGLRMSVALVPRDNNASRSPGLVTPFLTFQLSVIMGGLNALHLVVGTCRGSRLLPLSSPLHPVYCLSSHPYALRHGSFHASFYASFPLD